MRREQRARQSDNNHAYRPKAGTRGLRAAVAALLPRYLFLGLLTLTGSLAYAEDGGGTPPPQGALEESLHIRFKTDDHYVTLVDHAVPAGDEGKYLLFVASEPVVVSVQCPLKWVVRAIPLVPGGTGRDYFLPSELFMEVRSLDGNSVAQEGFIPFNGSDPSPIGGGIATSNLVDVFEVILIARVSPELPAGNYHGQVLFQLVDELGVPYIQNEVVLNYSCDDKPFCSINVAGELNFGTVIPREAGYLTHDPVSVNVRTNMTSVRIVVRQTALLGETGNAFIPGSQTCISFGATDQQARDNVSSLALDNNSIPFTFGPGNHTFFLCSKAQITIQNDAGMYHGVCNVGVEPEG